MHLSHVSEMQFQTNLTLHFTRLPMQSITMEEVQAGIAPHK